MRNYLLLLLLVTFGLQAQTLPSPAYNVTTTNTLKVKTPATVTSVNFLGGFDTDGISISKIDPILLPISNATQIAIDSLRSEIPLPTYVNTYKNDFTADVTQTFSVPDSVKVSNVYVGKLAIKASEWTQTGSSVTVTSSLVGDLVTLTGFYIENATVGDESSVYVLKTEYDTEVEKLENTLGFRFEFEENADDAVYRFTDSYIGSAGALGSQASMWVDVFPVTEGEQIRVKGSASRVGRFWTYLSSYTPYTKITNGPSCGSGEAYDQVLTIPAGVPYLAVTRSLQVFRLVEVSDLSKQIEFFGDSLTAGAGGGGTTIPNVVGGLLGSQWTVFNYGVGGENTTTIIGRQGGAPFYIKDALTIPANATNVLIDTPNGLFSSYNDASVAPLVQGDNSINPCYVQGKLCNLSYSSGTGKYSIRLNSAGTRDLVIPAKSQITPRVASVKANRISVYYIGQNAGYTDGTDLKNQFKKMADFKGDGRFLVVSSHGNGFANVVEPLTAEFGLKHVNMKVYMSKYAIYDAIDLGYLPNDGTYPTAQDLIDMAAQEAPTTLRSDPIHLNALGYTMEGRYIYNRLIQLHYIN